jgi:hypothetical protein
MSRRPSYTAGSPGISRHNQGRKPFYKEHRRLLVPAVDGGAPTLESAAEQILSVRAGPWDEWNRNMDWQTDHDAALNLLALANADVEKTGLSLGRSPKALTYRARDLGLEMPAGWAKLIRPKYTPHPREAKVILAYPYIQKARPEHADLLRANSLVPKGLPDWIRADVCQSVMVALYEGSVSLDILEKNQKNVRWFIARFYKEQMPREEITGFSTSEDDERPYYDASASFDGYGDPVSRDLNEARFSYDTWKDHTEATQVYGIYNREIAAADAFAQSKDIHLGREGVRQLLESGAWDMPSPAYAKLSSHNHAIIRAAERYGLALKHEDLRVISAACSGVKPTWADAQGDMYNVTIRGVKITVAFDGATHRVMTVLPRAAGERLRPLPPEQLEATKRRGYEYREKYHPHAGPR